MWTDIYLKIILLFMDLLKDLTSNKGLKQSADRMGV